MRTLRAVALISGFVYCRCGGGSTDTVVVVAVLCRDDD